MFHCACVRMCVCAHVCMDVFGYAVRKCGFCEHFFIVVDIVVVVVVCFEKYAIKNKIHLN